MGCCARTVRPSASAGRSVAQPEDRLELAEHRPPITGVPNTLLQSGPHTDHTGQPDHDQPARRCSGGDPVDGSTRQRQYSEHDQGERSHELVVPAALSTKRRNPLESGARTGFLSVLAGASGCSGLVLRGLEGTRPGLVNASDSPPGSSSCLTGCSTSRSPAGRSRIDVIGDATPCGRSTPRRHRSSTRDLAPTLADSGCVAFLPDCRFRRVRPTSRPARQHSTSIADTTRSFLSNRARSVSFGRTTAAPESRSRLHHVRSGIGTRQWLASMSAIPPPPPPPPNPSHLPTTLTSEPETPRDHHIPTANGTSPCVVEECSTRHWRRLDRLC